MSRTHIGEEFQKETKYARNRTPAGQFQEIERPERYKRYPDAKQIPLPEPETTGGTGLWETVTKRRSLRNYSSEEMSLEELSQLLWSTQGVTKRLPHHELRAAPSAGALYPIDTYLVVNHVSGLEPGVYHYQVDGHGLELLKSDDEDVSDVTASAEPLRGSCGVFGQQLTRAALHQKMCQTAAVCFIWTAVFNRSKVKYKQRCFRYVYLDAGHICAHLTLAAEALGLGSCAIAAFYDEEVNELLGVDGEDESTLYLCAVGPLEEGE